MSNIELKEAKTLNKVGDIERKDGQFLPKKLLQMH
jgi:hypothetical protein